MTEKKLPCLDKEPPCREGDACMTPGSGIGRLVAHDERRMNAKVVAR